MERRKINILYVIENIIYGGGERSFSQVIRRLPREEFNIFIASAPGGVFEKEISEDGLKINPVNFSSRYNIRIAFDIRKIIIKNRIDIVHSQGARADFYSRIASRITGNTKIVNTIAMPVEGFDVSFPRRTIYQVFDRLTERYVDKFIVVSNTLVSRMTSRHKIDKSKVIKIYNGIELDRYIYTNNLRYSCRGKFSIEKNKLVIGFIGRFVWQKGIEYLLEASKIIQKVYPEVVFLLVGDGELKDKLIKYAEDLGVKENCFFTGFYENIPEILAGIDILVVPSILEGFPIIILEGMAMQRPIIATNIEGIREQIIDNENGLLVPPKNPQKLAEAIILLLEDKELANRLALSARKTVEDKFDINKIANEMVNLYQNLTHG